MLAFVRQIFDILLAGTNFIGSFILLIFNVSRYIGFFVVKYLVLTFAELSNIFHTTLSVFNVLYEDFCIFFADFINRISDVCFLLCSSATAIFYAFKNAIGLIKTTILYIYESVFNVVGLIGDSAGKSLGVAVDFAELLKWLVILVGRGFWLAIQLIPLCLLYLGYSIFSLCVYILTVSYEQSSICLSYLLSKVSQAGQWTKSYLFDFPLEAVFGLVLGISLIYFSTKYRVRIRLSVYRSVRRTIRLIRSALMCIGLMFMHSLQSWRRNPVQPAVDSDSDSTQDEEPALRRSIRIQTRSGNKLTKESPDTLRRQLEREQEEKLCVVCQDQYKCVIVIPCRHLCLCGDCSQIIQHTTRTCPICRHEFDKVLTVYM